LIRLFKVYYPVRTLVLLLGEALIVWLSFVLGAWGASWLSEVGFPRPALLRSREGPTLFGLLAVTGLVLLLSHGFDLYDTGRMGARLDQTFRLLLVLGVVALTLSAVGFVNHRFVPNHDFLPRDSALVGLVILTFALLGWRATYSSLMQWHYLRERVYVLGTGDRAERLLDGLLSRGELGIEVVGWTGQIKNLSDHSSKAPAEIEGRLPTKVDWRLTADVQLPDLQTQVAILQKKAEPDELTQPTIIESGLTRDTVANHLLGLARENGVHRVIVAMPDRRGLLPVQELLDLRLAGVKVEEATSWLEKISGKIEVEHLYPSWLIFAEGFRFSPFFRLVRRLLNFSVAFVGLLLSLPLLPFIWLAIKLDSPGPVVYRQKRVGKGGRKFDCYKFRTMRPDAEADTGATWAADDDPRITRVGKILRLSRLDEIPQMWCVLKGDMNFVGPRPERPEFVERLSKDIPFYGVRHMVRPGITGWAQVKYKYGNTHEDAREKLQYDLFYIKNASVGLDLLILFQTIKIVLLGRGAQ
jgi:lipopolysaccharide/colanic/teichoic acid biosynthesis glycosyltransferase